MNTINDIYDFLNNTDASFKYITELTEPIKKLRDELANAQQEEEAQKCQWEIDFMNFTISDNELHPIFSTTNDKGEIYKYPDLALFNDATFEYLLKRVDDVKSTFLKKHYSHLLWLSPKRNIKYAHSAIENYFKLIEFYKKQDIENPKDFWGLKVREAHRNIFILSTSIKYKIEEVKKMIINTVINFNKSSSSAFVMRLDLIELMLDNKKIFAKEDFTGVDSLCDDFAKSLEITNPHLSIDFYNLIIKINNKLGSNSTSQSNRIAELYEKMSYDREDETNLAAIAFCEKALNIYKELKNDVKVDEMTLRYKTLKEGMQLNEIGKSFDYSEVFKTLKQQADIITEQPSSEIILTLMSDKNIIPDLEYLKQHADENKNSFLYVVPTQIIDRNGHTSQHFTTEDERYEHEILNSMNDTLILMRNHFIREIFFQAIKKNKLSANSILLYLNQKSWYGKNLTKSENGKEYSFNWLNLLAPSLHEYFRQIEHLFNVPQNYPNLVLAIDSLVLKFEGLIRDLCELIGVTTFFFTNDNDGRSIAREKDINVLIREAKLVEMLIPDDLFFLKFILVEKAGCNLRNSIAHSLMKYEGYTIEYMHLLIIGLLKLGKYDFVSQGEKPQNE
jgi:hypothetical protein